MLSIVIQGHKSSYNFLRIFQNQGPGSRSICWRRTSTSFRVNPDFFLAQWQSWLKTWKAYGNHKLTLQFQALQSSGHPNSPYYLLSALHLALFPSLTPGLVFKQLLSISFWKVFHASNPLNCSLPATLIYLVVNETYTDLRHRTWLSSSKLLALETMRSVAALNWALKTKRCLEVLKSISFNKLSYMHDTHHRALFCKKLSLLTPSTRGGEQLAVLAKGKLQLLWSPTVVQTLQVCKIIALMFI